MHPYGDFNGASAQTPFTRTVIEGSTNFDQCGGAAEVDEATVITANASAAYARPPVQRLL